MFKYGTDRIASAGHRHKKRNPQRLRHMIKYVTHPLSCYRLSVTAYNV